MNAKPDIVIVDDPHAPLGSARECAMPVPTATVMAPDFPYEMGSIGGPPNAPCEVFYTPEPEPREPRPRQPGSRRTPAVDKLYGKLVKAGHVRIIRKKGRAPVIEWL